jgi:hypothetical protein
MFMTAFPSTRHSIVAARDSFSARSRRISSPGSTHRARGSERKAHAPDPAAARYQTVPALAADVNLFLAGRAVGAHRERLFGRLARASDAAIGCRSCWCSRMLSSAP